MIWIFTVWDVLCELPHLDAPLVVAPTVDDNMLAKPHLHRENAWQTRSCRWIYPETGATGSQ
jgi:hypothetical protein